MFGQGKHKPKFSFDELVTDTFTGITDSIEQPVSRNIFYVIFICLIVISFIVIGRLVFLNIIKGTFYTNRAEANLSREIKTPAPRGLITDRFDNSLVENIPTFSVVLNVADFIRSDSQTQTYILDSLQDFLGIDSYEVKTDLMAINLERNNELLISKNITLSQAVTIKSQNIPSVFIVDDFQRHYLYPFSLSHLLGYTAEVTRDNIKEDPNLDLGDDIGKVGLELYYDEALRGQKGNLVDFKDVRGEIVDQRRIIDSIPGDTIKLTIDNDLQQFFYRRMVSALNNLGRTSGVGIAMNPQTGEILAALSFPSFDSNSFVDESRSSERMAWLNSDNRPLFNRYSSGVYNPGSTIKPLVALAALTENIVTEDDIFYSKGYIEIPNPYHPDQPSRFVDWKPHGWVNVFSALARSSNVYFYYIGGGFEQTKGLGIDRLNSWWNKFNLGEPTGIDLPNEKEGFLPDAEEREERTGIAWRLGDTYNVSIGQGDLAITPLGLLNYISTIANGGYLFRPYLASNKLSPELVTDISYLHENITKVQQGMIDAVEKPYGTANILYDLPMAVAGKTGSAQVSGKTKTNAFFVGYAPAENPEIAILILVEDAKEGSLNTVPVAKEVLYWYYTNRIQN